MPDGRPSTVPATIPVPDFFQLVSPCAFCDTALVYATEDDTVRCTACKRRWRRYLERNWLLIPPPTEHADA